MKYGVVFRDYADAPEELIHKQLQKELLSKIGGLHHFYGTPIVLTLNYETRKMPISPLDNSIEHCLTAEITAVQVNKVEYFSPPQLEPIKRKYTRWERFKQFVKGE